MVGGVYTAMIGLPILGVVLLGAFSTTRSKKSVTMASSSRFDITLS